MSDRRARAHAPGILTRRHVLYSGGLVAVSATAAGCGLFDTDPEEEGGGGGAKGKEAPMLAEQVAAGDLPPVEERLPSNPLVVPVTDRIGTYGGTWRTAVTGEADGPWLHRTIGYEALKRFDRAFSTTILNIAESVTASDDATEFTVTLRAGHKWSDGHPLTTEDVQFAFDILTNTELNQTVHYLFMSGSDLVQLEIVDEQTFIIRSPNPSGLWTTNIARNYDGDRLVSFPKHYLQDFLPEYNPNAQADAEAAGYETWQERFNDLGNGFSPFWNNPDLPSLKGWIAIEPLRGATTRALFRRNPYYFKVDEEGSQLPYLDEVQYDIIAEADAMLLRALNGDFDMHSRHFNNLENRPTLAEGQEAGNYHFFELQPTRQNDMVINLNLHHRDEAKREAYQNKDFRVALSHAIDRERLINAVWQRQGVPWQAAPNPESIYYDEEFAHQYLEHNPDLANQILDDAGFDERDGDDFRLMSNGERLSVRVSVATETLVEFWVQALELVKQDWEAVGVECILDPKPRDAFETEKNERTQDCTVWIGEGGRGDEIFQPRSYMAFDFESHFGNSWAGVWRGQEYEPEDVPPPAPEPILEQQRLYDQFTSTADEAGRQEVFRQIIAIAKEQFWVIGTVRVEQAYGIVHNRLQNVGGPLPASSTFDTPAPANPEQWFIDESAA